MSSVLFTCSAQTDLLAAWTFIAEDNFAAADHNALGAASNIA
jgi:hypothetical protein